MKEISSEKAKVATEKADNAKKAAVITKLTREVAVLKRLARKEANMTKTKIAKIAAPTVRSSTNGPSN